jgi:eukaryotic-like serine/threonine-protein kinase
MPADCAPDCGTHPLYTKSAGYSPLPGYVLLEPLGRGGFGEVWKCEAPGGLHKAVKFVTGDESLCAPSGESPQLRQEYEAFQQVKAIRHPFLLSLERVELIGGELIMVMELADRQLGDRFAECRSSGLQGIPRDELLGYLREAAEALDVISAKYGLQHLDVKPANLFLTAGHVQVGDYGLVSRLDARKGEDNRGLTPRYAAPEVLRGEIHTRSDQYSLALVYFELLTGAFPYNGRNAQMMMMQHLSVAPDLSALPEMDRGAVSTALAKQPEARYDSCAAFVRALISAGRAAGLIAAARPTRPSGSVATPPPGETTFSPNSSSAATRGPGSPDEPTRHDTSALVPTILPRRPTYPTPHEVLTPAPVEQMASRPPVHNGVVLSQIHSVVPIAWLKGHRSEPARRPPEQLVRAIVSAAEAAAGGQSTMGAVTREPGGVWGCRFLTTIDPRVAQVKLELVWEQCGVTMDTRTEGRVVFRKLAPVPAPTGGLFGFGKKSPKAPDAGLEVIVELPEPKSGTGEVVARGQFFGSPPPEFNKSGEKTIVRLLDGIRRTLNNVEERRKHPRVSASFPLLLYPLHSDGRVEPSIRSFCHDVSVGGMALYAPAKPPAKYAYVAFEEVPGAAGLAVLLQIIRAEWQQDEVFVTGRYRLDLGPEVH